MALPTIPLVMGFIASPLRSSYAVGATRAPQPVAAFPALPVGIAVGALTLAGIRRAKLERDNFFAVEWKDTSEVDADGDGCVLLGEEMMEGGKSWFLCAEPSNDPNVDCTPVESYGNPRVSGVADEGYLCKAPKPQGA